MFVNTFAWKCWYSLAASYFVFDIVAFLRCCCCCRCICSLKAVVSYVCVSYFSWKVMASLKFGKVWVRKYLVFSMFGRSGYEKYEFSFGAWKSEYENLRISWGMSKERPCPPQFVWGCGRENIMCPSVCLYEYGIKLFLYVLGDAHNNESVLCLSLSRNSLSRKSLWVSV